MGLDVTPHKHGEERRTTVGLFVAKDRLWLTEDRERVVEEGDHEAFYLYAVPGDEVPIAEAERYGLVKGKKQAAKPADKQRKPQADK